MSQWEPGLGPTTKERVIIEIDPDTGEFALEFFGGDLDRIYNVLLQITAGMQDGSLFKEGGIKVFPTNNYDS